MLELDGATIRYYERPVEIEVAGEKALHVPDVLVYRQGSVPCLYDIESKPVDLDRNRYKECERFAAKNNWLYRVVYPNNMPKVMERNISLLMGFTEKRSNLTQYKQEILFRVRSKGDITIRELAKSLQHKENPLLILPLIYNLIAAGDLYVDLQNPINEHSLVKIGGNHEGNTSLFMWGDAQNALQ